MTAEQIRAKLEKVTGQKATYSYEEKEVMGYSCKIHTYRLPTIKVELDHDFITGKIIYIVYYRDMNLDTKVRRFRSPSAVGRFLKA